MDAAERQDVPCRPIPAGALAKYEVQYLAGTAPHAFHAESNSRIAMMWLG